VPGDAASHAAAAGNDDISSLSHVYSLILLAFFFPLLTERRLCYSSR
jgi:hypothetical protein